MPKEAKIRKPRPRAWFSIMSEESLNFQTETDSIDKSARMRQQLRKVAEQKNPAFASKYTQSLLLVGLVIILAIILFVVFGPADIKNLGLLGKRQESQKSFAYSLSAPRAKDLVVSPAGSCDANGKRNYSFGWFSTANLPNVEEGKQLYFKFAVKNASGDWEYSEGEGFFYKQLEAGKTGSILYQYKLAAGVNAPGEKFTGETFSEPVTFAATCVKEAVGCLPYGDVNFDGKRDSADVSLVKKHIVSPSLLDLQIFAADANRDGNVDSADATVISEKKCTS